MARTACRAINSSSAAASPMTVWSRASKVLAVTPLEVGHGRELRPRSRPRHARRSATGTAPSRASPERDAALESPRSRTKGYCSSWRSTFAIWIAASAASAPLLPAFVPARSIACSIVSTVSTPNPIGNLLGQARCVMPRARLAGDVVEMRRGAADHAAERDQRLIAAARRELLDAPAASRTRPGTRTTSMSPGATPCFVSVSTAASSSRSTMKSLKRDATMPKRSPRALKSPSTT